MKKILHKSSLMFLLLAMAGFAIGQPMPDAITIEPEGATAFDEITLTFNANLACVPEGKGDLKGLESIAMHSAMRFMGDELGDWGHNGVDYNGTPGGDYDTRLTNNGDDTYSKTFVPVTYYNLTGDEGVFIGISAVFNNGTNWDNEGKDTGDGACTDFKIPLAYTSGEPVGNFNVNMNKVIDAGTFIPGIDKVWLIIEGVGEWDLIDLDENFIADGIYYVKIETGLEKDATYTYYYRINNNTPEDETREFTALGGPNTFNDWWNQDPIVYPATVTFMLDMTHPISLGEFDPEADFVDVAGSFNGWGPAEGEYHLAESETEGVYTIDVDGLNAGESYDFKFRINANWDTSEFPGGGPNRNIKPVEGEQTVNLVYNTVLHFTVDMTKAIDEGAFDPEADFVDVAGSFNDWGGSAHLNADDAENVYSIDVLNVKPGDVIEYKFRINGSWDSNEFPGDLPNRSYTAIYGYQIVHHFFDVTLGIEDAIRFEEISFYPNPIANILVIENADRVDRIVLSNLAGQEVKTFTNLKPKMEVNTSDLNKGVYFLIFETDNGSRKAEKIIKQ
jgi:hypothetical protein